MPCSLRSPASFLHFLLLIGFCLPLTAMADSSWCVPPNPPDTFDAFPGTGFYPSGPARGAFSWEGESFESYQPMESIECSNRDRWPHLVVTSGCLEARRVGGYGRGFTDHPVFRVLAVGRSGGRSIKWTDQKNTVRAYIKKWQQAACATCGVHLFARYRTENDLYVASLRQDGLVTIKKKLCGVYSTLATAQWGQPSLGAWYTLDFSAEADRLTFGVNGETVLQVQDATFSWGTSGIRTDQVEVYFDDWKVRAP